MLEKRKNYPKKEGSISIDKIIWFGKKPKQKKFPFHNREHFQRLFNPKKWEDINK